MLHFINNYSLNLGERVECYFNSKKNMISVRSIDIRNNNYLKIVAYAKHIHLEDCLFSYCANNHRKIFKGTFAGSLPILPSKDHIILHDQKGFFTTAGERIIGAKFSILYLNMLMAEQIIPHIDKRELQDGS